MKIVIVCKKYAVSTKATRWPNFKSNVIRSPRKTRVKTIMFSVRVVHIFVSRYLFLARVYAIQTTRDPIPFVIDIPIIITIIVIAFTYICLFIVRSIASCRRITAEDYDQLIRFELQAIRGVQPRVIAFERAGQSAVSPSCCCIFMRIEFLFVFFFFLSNCFTRCILAFAAYGVRTARAINLGLHLRFSHFASFHRQLLF